MHFADKKRPRGTISPGRVAIIDSPRVIVLARPSPEGNYRARLATALGKRYAKTGRLRNESDFRVRSRRLARRAYRQGGIVASVLRSRVTLPRRNRGVTYATVTLSR